MSDQATAPVAAAPPVATQAPAEPAAPAQQPAAAAQAPAAPAEQNLNSHRLNDAGDWSKLLAEFEAGTLQGLPEPTPAEAARPAPAAEPQAPAPVEAQQPVAAAPIAPPAPAEPPPEAKPRKELGDGEPVKPRNLRERLLEDQTRKPLESQLQELQQRLQETERQRAMETQRVRELFAQGKFDEATQLAFGTTTEGYQRAILEAKGAVQRREQNPELEAVRAELQQFRNLYQQQQQAAREQQVQMQRRQQEETHRQLVIEEMKQSGYDDVARLASVDGFANMVLQSMRQNPQLDNEHHYRQAKARYKVLADQLMSAMYPDLSSKLSTQPLAPQPGAAAVPPVTQTTGVNPEQAGVMPAGRPVPQPGVSPVQPRVSAVPTALPQEGSADAGKRKYSSKDEEWRALLDEAGLAL